MKSSTSKHNDDQKYSPTKKHEDLQDRALENGFTIADIVSPSSDEKEKKSQSDPEIEDDEFYECFDDQKDISMLESQIQVRQQRVFSEVPATKSEKSQPTALRRTASYSNILIQEAANEDEEDDDVSNGQHINGNSPDKQRFSKFKQMAQHDRMSKGVSILNSTRTARSYFE